MLPRDLLGKIFSHLGTPRDVNACVLTCRFFAQAAAFAPEIWRGLAVRRYGEQVADATIHLYDGNWRSMLADDNKRGALPTVYFRATRSYNTCDRTLITMRNFKCCELTALQWDRRNHKVRLYLDAHGYDQQLRQPLTSSVCVRSRDIRTNETFRPETWIADKETRRNYKGYLVFDEARFLVPNRAFTTYSFCYGDFYQFSGCIAFDTNSEFELVSFLGRSLDTFSFVHYTLDVSLYANDTPEIDQARWRRMVLSSNVTGTGRRRLLQNRV